MEVRRKFYAWYHRVQHLLVPRLRYSQDIFEDELDAIVHPGCSWLDVGCGHHLLPRWRLQKEQELVRRAGTVVGIDLDFPALRKHITMSHVCMATVSQLPFADATFDLVTANMVVEHLDDPITQFGEVRRVLKPGGLFLFHTPNIFGYTTISARMVPESMKASVIRFVEGRAAEDVFPAHYRANSRKQIASVARSIGMEILKFRLITSAAQLVMIPPLVIAELLWIRLLMTRPFRGLRTNIIACLKRPLT